MHAKVPYLSLEKEKENVCVVSHADVLRGSSRRVKRRRNGSCPRTSAELKVKFLSHCSQITAGDLMQIIGDPIGAC